MNVNEKIKAIRDLMIKNKIDFYIIPSADFHQSEDVGKYFRCREFVSGFTGSSGTLLITKEKSYLWTDGRYFIQAEKELFGSEIELFKSGMKNVPMVTEFLKENVKNYETVGFDGRVVSYFQMKEYTLALKGKNVKFVLDFDFAGDIWKNRPSLSKEKIFLFDLKYCGETFESKIKRLREKIKELGATAHIITSLDDIAWLFNIRGNDIPCNPVVLSYAYITLEKVILFVDKDKITKEVEKYFSENNLLAAYNIVNN